MLRVFGRAVTRSVGLASRSVARRALPTMVVAGARRPSSRLWLATGAVVGAGVAAWRFSDSVFAAPKDNSGDGLAASGADLLDIDVCAVDDLKEGGYAITVGLRACVAGGGLMVLVLLSM